MTRFIRPKRAPRPRLRRLLAALAVAAVAAVLLPLGAAQSASAATSTCDPQGTITAGDYTIQANEWNSTLQQCIGYSGGTAWSVDTANFNLGTNGAPATYPSIFKGCHWGDCTPNSGLPIQVSRLGSATSSWSTVQPASGAYDVAYDLWINSTPTTKGQPDGTEIMIWLNSRGGVQPFGAKTGTSSAAGHSWDVWTGQQTSWKIISYVLQGGGTSFSNLDVKALIDDAVSRGSVNPSHYLIDAEAGFEIWQGGQGLATNSFSFAASTGGSTPPGGGTPPAGNGCTAAYKVSNDWGSGFTADVTVTAGSAAIHGWTVTWSYGGGQQVTNAWNAGVHQSGSAVTATDAGYNGSLGAGGSTSFGVQGTGSGGSAPALTCTAR
ncbi:GH12 family glycosyl hydrolase domain-containing protein [Actinacidiphila guanduensis]|uniref:Cellulose 1,4-beta-cellobiosidase n=1 Tax=Actinacidiphila guanduensis TaxID=310781 RepID=A0A1G9VVK9_9ACTN|nr:cellulose binding domain-containing protein [Actinacidiphila guanduensis]SDM76016.1 cellulose 1,4-beta-cellobiosidase [Actinacidiphila guanduensis]